MATKPGKIVTVLFRRGAFVLQDRRFLRNRKGLRLKGIVRRGGP